MSHYEFLMLFRLKYIMSHIYKSILSLIYKFIMSYDAWGWCPGAELNHRHLHFQCSALPTELPGQAGGAYRESPFLCPDEGASDELASVRQRSARPYANHIETRARGLSRGSPPAVALCGHESAAHH